MITRYRFLTDGADFRLVWADDEEAAGALA